MSRLRDEQVARALCFEITETAAVASLSKATYFMRELKARGCRFSLDDFGSGVSSFVYLKTLPVDFLKIDGQFAAHVATDVVDRSMVEAIAKIGSAMQVATIAEKVESAEVLQVLKQIGVDYIQGFHLAEPCAIEDVFTCRELTRAHATRVVLPLMATPGNVEPAFSLGMEEEYLLVDLATRDLVSDPPAELLQRCIAETDGRVSPEFLRSQLEVKTSVCGSVAAMRRELGGAAPQGVRSRGRLRHRAHRRVDASVRAARASSAAHRPRALRRHRARSAGRGAAHDHLRHARARRARRRRAAHRRHEPAQLLRAAPAGAVVFVAVLGRRGHGHAVVPAHAAVVAAAHRAARALRELR